MSFLFWIIWVLNLLLVLLTAAGSDFREGFGAGTGFNSVVLIITVMAMIGSLVMRYFFHQNKWSVWIVCVPAILLLLMYIFEKMTVGE